MKKHYELDIYTVDSFTNKAFYGNPAGVCCLPYDMEFNDATLQNIAAEMNLSETAFVKPVDGTHDFHDGRLYQLRWFTPSTEVRLCGHATLATAAVIFHCYENKSSILEFETFSGHLEAIICDGRITLNFPINEPEQEDIESYKEIIDAVVDESLVEHIWYQKNSQKLLIRLSDRITRSDLEKLSIDFASLKMAKVKQPVMGVIITARGDSGFDFMSRYFAPWVGIMEDPVTGSAHTVLASYWSKMLSKTNFTALQCSKRSGCLKISIKGDRVFMTGEAVIVMKAKFMFEADV